MNPETPEGKIEFIVEQIARFPTEEHYRFAAKFVEKWPELASCVISDLEHELQDQ